MKPMDKPKPGFLSSEFYAAIGTAVAAMVAVFVALGKLTPEGGDALSKNTAAAVTAVGGAVTAVWAVVSYVKGRTAVKEAHEAAKGQVESSK